MAVSLCNLPWEIFQKCVSSVSPFDLAALSSTCQTLYKWIKDDSLWEPHVNSTIWTPLQDPLPYSSFRELYIAHNRFWFVAERNIWISNHFPYGKLAIARYNSQHDRIDILEVLASFDKGNFRPWSRNPDISILLTHTDAELHLNEPIISLKPSDCRVSNTVTSGAAEPSVLKDITYTTTTTPGLRVAFQFCAVEDPTLVPTLGDVWPPAIIPSCGKIIEHSRLPTITRRGNGDFSSSMFHISKSIKFGHPGLFGSRYINGQEVLYRHNEYWHPNQVNTFMTKNTNIGQTWRSNAKFAAIAPEAYIATESKPWQGIYSGDYGAHNSEFILVTQLDTERIIESLDLKPRQIDGVREWLRVDSVDPQQDSPLKGNHDDGQTNRGSIVAVKLTGDPNIPRGQYTFIAPDISDNGTLRIAEEEEFTGARVVRAVGHVDSGQHQLNSQSGMLNTQS